MRHMAVLQVYNHLTVKLPCESDPQEEKEAFVINLFGLRCKLPAWMCTLSKEKHARFMLEKYMPRKLAYIDKSLPHGWCIGHQT